MKFPIMTIMAALCAAAPLASRADISWIIKPAASGSGRMQLFTSRADKPRPRTILIDAPKNEKQFKSMRFRDSSNGFTGAGINTNGVAVAFSGAGPTTDKALKLKKGQRPYNATYAIDQILRHGKTAKQSVDMLRKAAREGLFPYSMIFLVVDPGQALIFEVSPRHQATYPLGLSYAVYSNVWKLPGMEDASGRTPKNLSACAQREWVAKTGIMRARQGDRKVSVAEAIAVSRLNAADMKREDITSAPSSKNSIDAYLFEIDPKHPAVLSCVYAALGPQRHTVYLPIPLGAMDELPDGLAAGEYAAIGDGIAKKSTPDTPVSGEIIEFERGLHQEFNDIRFKAAQLIDENKTDEAKSLLVDTLRRQYQEVLKFMQEHK